MNVLYIIGNGFDKAQGMNTSYPDFYKYLRTLPNNDNPLLEKLINCISDRYELWSDMEKGLGLFTKEIENSEDFDTLYFYLSDKLQEYLKTEEDRFIPSEPLKSKFQKDIFSIRENLADSDKLRYDVFLDRFHISTSVKDISIMTLNYTNTLEKLFFIGGRKFPLVFNNNNILRKIIHVHGILDDTIILGVDNEEQIGNKDFKNNLEIKDYLIKRQSYESIKTTNHIECENLIKTAKVIVLYGVSLGDTDKSWWRIIGDNLIKRNNLALIQYLYAPNTIPPTRKQKIAQLERRQQNNIMRKMDIDPSLFNESIKERLFFVVNSKAYVDK
ncbi:bacteriophage abortive infection AbiH family protein [uncultured Prevotella sp.]|uniref:bacteriophage abortive infection AbiH family protein n=1 Tax=uncultured Prevotella sp. TaxID=159272 RepID=UPI002674F3FB|nr:bacteriophage abortive infection AbiH family protein [uncultured Prevotella sp.]